MKRILFALVALTAVVSAACRQYDVDVYRNVNGWTQIQPNNRISQSFICTADSLLWAEFFVGAANSGGQYVLQITPYPSGDPLYTGQATAASDIQYEFVRADLSPVPGAPALVKGETYVLKVTHSTGEPINYYYSDQNPYPYGYLLKAGVPEPTHDLAARIEGVNRPVNSDFIGMNGRLGDLCKYQDVMDSSAVIMHNLGISWTREAMCWCWTETLPGDFKWAYFDSVARTAACHGLHVLPVLTTTPPWASTHIDTIIDSLRHVHVDTSEFCPPCSLYARVLDVNNNINPHNYWGQFVYDAVQRYMPNSPFWNANAGFDGSITTWEIWNEPNDLAGCWQTPDGGHGYHVPSDARDTIALQETLYARLFAVACSAAHHAYSGARVLTGGTELVELAKPQSGLPVRLVPGKDWLRAFYAIHGQDDDSGSCVHPYQNVYPDGGSGRPALIPDTFRCDMDTMREVMREHDAADKRLWATEISWGPDTDDATEQRAPLSIPGAYLLSLAGSPTSFYDKVFYLGLWDKRLGTGALMRFDSSVPSITPKPGYYAFQQMTQELLGKRLNGRILTGDPAVDTTTELYELEDTATGGKTWVGWRNYVAGAEGVPVKVPARTDSLHRIILARDSTPVTTVALAATDGWLRETLGQFRGHIT